MMSQRWLCLAGAIATEVIGSLALKQGAHEPLWYVVVAVTYAAAFFLLRMTLTAGMPLGIAYGIWGATGVALVALLSVLLYGESVGTVMVAGLVLVIAGVVLVELGSRHRKDRVVP